MFDCISLFFRTRGLGSASGLHFQLRHFELICFAKFFSELTKMQFCDPVRPCASTRTGVASASGIGPKSAEQSANVNKLKLPTSDFEEEKFMTEQNCRTKL